MNQARAKLAKDHEELGALLRRLAEDVDAPCPGELETTWAVFEGRLIRHLEAEEQLLLPLIEASNPDEVRRIREEHAHIRSAIAELGVAIELHSARKPHVTELIQFLQGHAQHEDEVLYRIAGDKASVAVEHSILEILKNAVRSAARELSADQRARP
jgi:hemerythrin-like domain-containing protein